VPCRPSNSILLFFSGEGESTAGYTFTPCVGSFACPGINTQVKGILVLHLIQRKAIKVKWHAKIKKWGGPWWESNPRYSEYESNALFTRPYQFSECSNSHLAKRLWILIGTEYYNFIQIHPDLGFYRNPINGRLISGDSVSLSSRRYHYVSSLVNFEPLIWCFE
jgi:hypothetical protein